MPSSLRCLNCGAELPPDIAEGMCSRCLAHADSADSDRSNPPVDHDATVDYPTAEHAKSQPITEPQSSGGHSFGDYELIAEIARGGMGVVWRARQVSLNRLVALKMIKSGRFADERDIQRFRDEAEAVANLDHPNIVPVYQVGERDGQQFFAMKLIDGKSLAQCLDLFKNKPKAIAELMIEVARAVNHAHQRGIIHRDLKPGNILIDSEGQPHVTDFGLAKSIGGDTGLTQSGAILGTPEYMAPEQARAEKGLTTAVDVYSLGAIMYTLLVGRPPFRSDQLLEILRQINEQEPARPSVLNSKVDRDLETICLKCLAKNPQRRLTSAHHLAEELRRYLLGLPIRARKVGRVERFAKWVKRRPTITALVVLTTVALIALPWAVLTINAQLRRERDAAKELVALSRSSLMNMQLQRVGAIYKEDPLQALALLEDERVCPEKMRDFAWGYYYRSARWQIIEPPGYTDDITSVALSANGNIAAVAYRGSNGRDYVVKIWDVPTRKLRVELQGHRGEISRIAISPDGKTLVSSNGPKIRVWNIDNSKEPTQEFLNGNGSGVLTLSISADSKTLVAGGWDDQLRAWSLATGKQLAEFKGHRGPIQASAINADGTIAVSGSTDASIKIWDIANKKEIGTLKGHGGQVLFLAITRDGKRLYSSGLDGGIKVWDIPKMQPLDILQHQGVVPDLALTPDGKTLVSAWNGVTLWDTKTGDKRTTLREKKYPSIDTRNYRRLAVSADAKTILTAGRDAVRIFQRPFDYDPVVDKHRSSIGLIQRLEAITPDNAIRAQATSVDGKRRTIYLIDTGTGKRRATLTTDYTISSLTFSRDGKTLAVLDAGGDIELWDIPTGRRRAALDVGTLISDRDRSVMTMSADSTKLYSANSGQITVWNVQTGSKERTLKVPDYEPPPDAPLLRGKPGAISSDGARLVWKFDQDVKLWDLAKGRHVADLYVQINGEPNVAFSPDNKTVAAAFGKNVKLMDAATGHERAMLNIETSKVLGHDARVVELIFSQDGRTLMASVSDGTVQVWRASFPVAGK